MFGFVGGRVESCFGCMLLPTFSFPSLSFPFQYFSGYVEILGGFGIWSIC